MITPPSSIPRCGTCGWKMIMSSTNNEIVYDCNTCNLNPVSRENILREMKEADTRTNSLLHRINKTNDCHSQPNNTSSNLERLKKETKKYPTTPVYNLDASLRHRQDLFLARIRDSNDSTHVHKVLQELNLNSVDLKKAQRN